MTRSLLVTAIRKLSPATVSPFGSVPQIYKYQKANQVMRSSSHGGRGNDTLSNQVSGVDVTFRGGAREPIAMIQNVQPLSHLRPMATCTHATGLSFRCQRAGKTCSPWKKQPSTGLTLANDLDGCLTAFSGASDYLWNGGTREVITVNRWQWEATPFYGNRGRYDNSAMEKQEKTSSMVAVGNDTLYVQPAARDKLYGRQR